MAAQKTFVCIGDNYFFFFFTLINHTNATFAVFFFFNDHITLKRHERHSSVISTSKSSCSGLQITVNKQIFNKKHPETV